MDIDKHSDSWRTWFLLFLLFVGCGGNAGSGDENGWSIFDRNRPNQCVPGDESFCRCDGGVPGWLYCKEDGSSLTKCMCDQQDMGVDLASASADMQADLGDMNTTPACVPDCEGLLCGVDPDCGVSCGECAFDELCTETRECVAEESAPNRMKLWINDSLVYSSDEVLEAFYRSRDDGVEISLGRRSLVRLNFAFGLMSQYNNKVWVCEDTLGGGFLESFWSVSIFNSYSDVRGYSSGVPPEWGGVGLSSFNCVDRGLERDDVFVYDWKLSAEKVTSSGAKGVLVFEAEGKDELEGQILKGEVYFDVSW